METPSRLTSAQDAYGLALDAIVDRGQHTYDDARRLLAGTATEQATLAEVAHEPLDGGNSLTAEQATDVLQWYRGKRGLGRAAAAISVDNSLTTRDGAPLLTIHEANAAMNNALKQH